MPAAAGHRCSGTAVRQPYSGLRGGGPARRPCGCRGGGSGSVVQPLRWRGHVSHAAAVVTVARQCCGRHIGGGTSAVRPLWWRRRIGVAAGRWCARFCGGGASLVRPPRWRRLVSVAKAAVGAAGSWCGRWGRVGICAVPLVGKVAAELASACRRCGESAVRRPCWRGALAARLQ